MTHWNVEQRMSCIGGSSTKESYNTSHCIGGTVFSGSTTLTFSGRRVLACNARASSNEARKVPSKPGSDRSACNMTCIVDDSERYLATALTNKSSCVLAVGDGWHINARIRLPSLRNDELQFDDMMPLFFCLRWSWCVVDWIKEGQICFMKQAHAKWEWRTKKASACRMSHK